MKTVAMFFYVYLCLFPLTAQEIPSVLTDDDFITFKFPAIMSSILIITFEKAVAKMNKKQQAEFQGLEIGNQLDSVFGAVSQHDREIVLQHMDALTIVLEMDDVFDGLE